MKSTMAWGLTVDQMRQACELDASTFDKFDAHMARDFAGTRDPALPARIAELALRLRRPVPTWAADWLADGLAHAAAHDGELDQVLGFVRGRGQRRPSVARRLRWQLDYARVALALAIRAQPGDAGAKDWWAACEVVAENILKGPGHPLSTETLYAYLKPGRELDDLRDNWPEIARAFLEEP